MAHSIAFTTAAAKELRRLSAQAQDQIRPIIDALAIQPRPSGVVKLEGGEFYRVRSGDYRIIYQIDDDVLRVLIVTVGNRREVYKKRR